MTLNMGRSIRPRTACCASRSSWTARTWSAAKALIGYLHTGMEKQAEYKTYTQSIPQTDRMDYLSPLSNNLALWPVRREAARHHGARARAGDPRAAHRAHAHQRPLRVARHARHRHRRAHRVLVLLQGAREGAVHLRHGVRRAHDRQLLPRRRPGDGHPRRACSSAARSSSTRCRRTSTSTSRC